MKRQKIRRSEKLIKHTATCIKYVVAIAVMIKTMELMIQVHKVIVLIIAVAGIIVMIDEKKNERITRKKIFDITIEEHRYISDASASAAMVVIMAITRLLAY